MLSIDASNWCADGPSANVRKTLADMPLLCASFRLASSRHHPQHIQDGFLPPKTP